MEYTKNLLDQAEKMLATSWGTNTSPVPASMLSPSMRMVKLPPLPGYQMTLVNNYYFGCIVLPNLYNFDILSTWKR